MKLITILLLFGTSIFYSCSSVPQIQTNINYATKGYVDTSVNNLKIQLTQNKKTIDSLKNIITINTIKIDTSSGSDFKIINGVMIVNKQNLNNAIKIEVLRWVPSTNVVIKK